MNFMMAISAFPARAAYMTSFREEAMDYYRIQLILFNNHIIDVGEARKLNNKHHEYLNSDSIPLLVKRTIWN